MSVIYLVIPLALVMAGIAVAAFFWAVRRGEFDDLDTPAYRAIFDDDASPKPAGPPPKSSDAE